MEIFHFVRSSGLLQWQKMRSKASGSRAAPLCLIVMLLAFGPSCTVQAQAPADDNSPAQNLVLTLWAVSDETIVQIKDDFYQAAHESGNAPEALAKVQGDWLVKLRKEKGLASAVNLAGPFIMSSRVKP